MRSNSLCRLMDFFVAVHNEADCLFLLITSGHVCLPAGFSRPLLSLHVFVFVLFHMVTSLQACWQVVRSEVTSPNMQRVQCHACLFVPAMKTLHSPCSFHFSVTASSELEDISVTSQTWMEIDRWCCATVVITRHSDRNQSSARIHFDQGCSGEIMI